MVGNPDSNILQLLIDAGTVMEAQFKSGAFNLKTFDQLEAEPDPVFVVDGLLKEGDLVVIYGMPKAGKSFVVLDLLASCTRRGNRFAGKFLINDAIPSVYATGEGRGGLKARSRALRAGHNLTIEEASLVLWCDSVPNLIPNDATDPRSLRLFLDALAEHLRRDEPGIIVLDTLRLCTVGLDENQTKDMGVVMDVLLNSIRDSFPRAITIVLHHSNKGGSMGGSLQIAGSADLILKVTKTKKGHQLECEDAKDIPGFAPLEFQLMPRESSAQVDWQEKKVSSFNPDFKRDAILTHTRTQCRGIANAKSLTHIAATMGNVSKGTVGTHLRTETRNPESDIKSVLAYCPNAKRQVEKWYSADSQISENNIGGANDFAD